MPHTIFLVEDDPALRGELRTLLERYGYACAATDDYELSLIHISEPTRPY